MGAEANRRVIPCLGTVSAVREAVAGARGEGMIIGLVPTMGALHEGHLSLIRAARKECGYVVVWVFVNPTQFGPQEDLARYPRDIERDLVMSTEAGADVVFAPSVEEIYPAGSCTWVDVEGLGDGLCGASRPGHFRGVCTVVTKFFNICAPDRAYFGEKDAQQLAIIRRMTKDLHMPVEIVGCPIVREVDGLAMSSRNAYLSEAERKQAPVLSRALTRAVEVVDAGERDPMAVEEAMRAVLESAPLAEVDYVAIVDAAGLQPVAAIAGECLIALAVRIGRTRLIDNVTVRV